MSTQTARKCEWTGKSGAKYTYEVHPIGILWSDVPGNYIFAKETAPGHWAPVYIGQTQSLRDRLPNHNELPCIKRNGGTHVHVHIARDERVRRNEENDLLAAHKTPCNG